MTKIKICGLTRMEDIAAVNIAKPEYVGFVFAQSRRKISPALAQELRKNLAADIIPVGVFVNEPIENILELVRCGTIEIIQLHGAEDEEYIRKLKQHTSIIRAIGIAGAGDVCKHRQTAADYLLLDNAAGGTGQSFDWDLIGETEKPFFLAGGLNPENISRAIAKTSPFAVDVSSGVETNGVKDSAKIHEFIRIARTQKKHESVRRIVNG